MSAASPESALGDCVVCGTRTATRCSECASNGTKWMYFCSRDHQKLIYKTHKRVCGKLSSPLRWPILNEKEAERMKEIGSYKDPDLPRTFEGMVTDRALGRSYDEFLEIATQPYGTPPQLDGYKFQGLIFLRGLAFATGNLIDAERSDSDQISYQGKSLEPFGFLIYEIGHHWKHLCSDYTQMEWWQPLMHRFIIYFALLAKRCSLEPSEEEPDDDKQHREHAKAEVNKLLKDTISRDHRQEANSLVAQLEQDFDLPGFSRRTS